MPGMTTKSARQPKGIPVGGQFAATAHDESAIALPAPPRALPELEPYGEIPAPLDGQTLETGEPAAATFEDSYRAFFAPLDEHEADHGPYTAPTPLSEGEILNLAGIGDVNLGRHRGTYLERDENTGEPVIVVHTRNGGGNRECYQDDCDGQCTGCVQTDAIPALPTYLRDEDDDGDSTYANNYFRAVDPAAGLAALEAQEKRETLQRLQYFRDAIASGKQPPWAVLSPVRGQDQRQKVYAELNEKRRGAAQNAQSRRTAEAVFAALENETAMPDTKMWRVPNEYYSYNTAMKYRDVHDSEAREARQAADALAAEMKLPLPPATAALVEREFVKLDTDAAKHEQEAAEHRAKIEFAGGVMRSWAWTLKELSDKADNSVEAAEAKLKDFDWSESFPGEVKDCPPRPLSAGS
jgi:hypothetical protein